MKEECIENKLMKVNKEELNESINKIGKEYFKVKIDGKKIQNWNNYIKNIGDSFNFPRVSRYPNYDGYSDWMRDLTWIPSDIIVLIIDDYESFMKDDEDEKNKFLDMITIILQCRNERRKNKNFSEKMKKTLLVYLVN